jgi:hypothetical protein
MFANDVTLVMASKSKTEQDEWLNAIMKGLSQGVRLLNENFIPKLIYINLAYGDKR